MRIAVDSDELNWLAGMVDGEGSISITNSRGKFYLQLTVTNTERGLLIPFLNRFSGSIHVVTREQRPNDRPIYFWVVGAQKALGALEVLYPILRSTRKRKAATLAIKFQRQKTHKRTRDPAYSREQRDYWLKMLSINGRKIHARGNRL